MAWKTKTYFAVSLPNEPGELDRFMQQLADNGVNLLGLWGYVPSGDEPRLSCVPESPDMFRRFVGDSGIIAEEGRTFYWTGDDRPGALVETLRRITDARINIDAIESVAVGDRYGCFVWAAERDWNELAQLLADS